MAYRYPYTTDGVTQLIPVADGDYLTGMMEPDFTIGNCFLQFYDADGITPITPTGGTITFKAGGFEGQFLADSGAIVVDATAVVGTGDATYTPPTFDSIAITSKMTLSGITGASFVRAYIWRA